MRAVKGNKEYGISEAQKKTYQDLGFDILDDDGSVISYGRGKTVPYEEYNALRKENEALKKELEELHQNQEPTERGDQEDNEEAEPKTGRKKGGA